MPVKISSEPLSEVGKIHVHNFFVIPSASIVKSQVQMSSAPLSEEVKAFSEINFQFLKRKNKIL